MKNYVFLAGFSLVFGFAGSWIFDETKNTAGDPTIPAEDSTPSHLINASSAPGNSSAVEFIEASKKSTPSVVYIKTISPAQVSSYWDDWFDLFGQRGEQAGSGSGVIVSEDGYIATNNHVVQGATSIEVVLNNKRYVYQAKVVGTDPSTDLALLKIDAKGLPAIAIGNSENVQIGEWVLAVGNPFNLTSTVTAGIVSAKGRNINVVNNQFPIESFIQTDAAINPGNSGGALVNQKGELIGINTAIASRTGAYNGYGFAIPVNIVSKIIKDLKEFGEVQRAFTGMEVVDITAELMEKTGNLDKGVYVAYVSGDGPAKEANLKEGAVIFKVNGTEVNSKATFDEQVAYYRPGEKLKLTLSDGKEVTLSLVNREGNTEMLKRTLVHSDVLGADFEKISKVERDRYGIEGGFRVSNISSGIIRKMNLQDGFIFVKLNNTSYTKTEDFIKALESTRGRIVIEGIHPNGSKQVLSFYYY
ncbi:MAG TPA: serine protease [Bacteroidetes bacterium]|nr:serine protease [Bacteroidota bacterium]